MQLADPEGGTVLLSRGTPQASGVIRIKIAYKLPGLRGCGIGGLPHFRKGTGVSITIS